MACECDCGFNKEVYDNKFNVLEDKIVELKEKMSGFDGIKEVLVELKIITTQQIEASFKMNAMLNEHGIVSAKTVEALDHLSVKHDRTEKDVANLNKKLAEGEGKNNIHISDIIKGAVLMALGAIATAIITGVIR